MKKKGMELTFNTIIIAVIALLVLIVVIAIFTGSIDDIADSFTRSTDRAQEQGDEAFDEIGIFNDDEDEDGADSG